MTNTALTGLDGQHIRQNPAHVRRDRILFVVGVVKWIDGFSSLAARVPAWPA
jgi:hypothetical protein